MPSDTAAGIPWEGTDCTPDEAVEAVRAVRAASRPVDLGRIIALAADLQDDIDRSSRPSVMVNRATLAEFVLETARLVATVERALEHDD